MTYADLSPLANHLWQSTVFAGAMWMLTLTLRRNRAAVRYWLWLAASVKFLIPFSILVGAGSQLGRKTITVIEPPQWSYVAEQISEPFATTAAAPLVAAPPMLHSVPALLFAIWLCGVAVGIFFWIRHWRQMLTLRRGAMPLNLDLPIPVVCSSTRVEPGVFGIREPILLMPEGIMERLTPAQLTAIVSHEMCHVRRRDNLTAAIHILVEILFWFYPVVWWIRTRLVEERERACDEEVLRFGDKADTYAEAILSVCRFYLQAPPHCVSAVSGGNLRRRIERITANHSPGPLAFRHKFLLVTAAVGAVVGPVVFGFASRPAYAQSATSKPGGPRFAVASVKRSDPGSVGLTFHVLPGGQTYFAKNVPLRIIIQRIYHLFRDQLSGPPWIDTERFDIEAKSEQPAKLAQLNEMFQNLLADRFNLQFHKEIKERPVYVLTVNKNGPKLQANDTADEFSGHLGPNIGRLPGMIGTGVSVSVLCDGLSQLLGQPVLDRTELKGYFDFKLEFAPEIAAPPPAEGLGAPPAVDGPSIFSAVREQLGLKLELQKGPVQVFVIDHIDRPSAN